MRRRSAQPDLLAIDPGSSESAWVVYDSLRHRPVRWAKEPNAVVLARLRLTTDISRFAIERIDSYGMAVGATVFETAMWTGRFIEAWECHKALRVTDVYRRDVKLHLCQSSRAKDSNIIEAIKDVYGPGKLAKGTKASPGPLYGIKADCWQALAVAMTVDQWPT